MGLKIPRALVEFVLLGPEDDRRQLQDSPILGDVWVEFARQPGERLELLITPYKEEIAAVAAGELQKAIAATDDAKNPANIAYLQGIVAARLRVDEVIQHVVPMTYWWGDSRIVEQMQDYLTNREKLAEALRTTRAHAEAWLRDTAITDDSREELATRERYSSLAALLVWAANEPAIEDTGRLTVKEESTRILARVQGREAEIVGELAKLFPSIQGRTGSVILDAHTRHS